MIRKISQTVFSLFLLSVVLPSAHAETNLEKITTQAQDALGALIDRLASPLFNSKDVKCLAKNIYFESRGEPEEGMVAVGVVTINRSLNPKYPESLCDVVNHRTRSNEGKIVCQFSWTCTPLRNKQISESDPFWLESLRIAKELSYGGYDEWREKYANSHHFHATHVNPGWKLKRIARIGRHIFYH
jgi:spore germination cell wall hydrolase CwlJ-like protein